MRFTDDDYDPVLDDARRDFACNRSAFPDDDDVPCLVDCPDFDPDEERGRR